MSKEEEEEHVGEGGAVQSAPKGKSRKLLPFKAGWGLRRAMSGKGKGLRLKGGSGTEKAYDVFITTNKDACVDEVLDLQKAIENHDYSVFITDATENTRKGSKKLGRIVEAISSAALVVVMGTDDYGEEIPDKFSSKEAMVFALKEAKPMFVFKMCQTFKHQMTAAYLADIVGENEYEEWPVGTPLKAEAVGKVLKRLRQTVGIPNLRQEKAAHELPKEGFGVFNFSEEVQYVGQWKNQKMHGAGKMTYTDGSVYEGAFVNGKKHGLGKYRFGEQNESAGDMYEGNFKDGAMHGDGVLTYSPFGKWAGDRYVGQWENAKRHGYGTYYYKSGARYTGYWSNGLKHGRGDFFFANGDHYSGDYREGKKHGKGTYTFKDGDKYEGEWKNNKRHGKGEYFSAETKNVYKGDFVHGAEEGYGELFFGEKSGDHGDTYKGHWKKGMMEGEGVYTTKTGKRMEGNWSKGNLVSI